MAFPKHLVADFTEKSGALLKDSVDVLPHNRRINIIPGISVVVRNGSGRVKVDPRSLIEDNPSLRFLENLLS